MRVVACLEDRGVIECHRTYCATNDWAQHDPQLHIKKLRHDYSVSRSGHLRQNDNYLDEKIKTVSARRTETLEVLWNQDALCCRPKLAAKPIAQKLSRCAVLATPKPLKSLMGQNVKSPFSNIRAGTFKLHLRSSSIADANRRSFKSRPATKSS